MYMRSKFELGDQVADRYRAGVSAIGPPIDPAFVFYQAVMLDNK